MPYEREIKVYVHSTDQKLGDHNLSHLIPSANKQVHLFCNIETTTTTSNNNMKSSKNNNNNNNVSMEDPFVFTDEGFQDLILLQPMNKNSSQHSTTNQWKKIIPFQDDVVTNKCRREEEEYKSSLEPISLSSLSLHKVPLSPKRNSQSLKRVNAHHEFNALYEKSPKASTETRETKKRNQNSALFAHRDCSYETTNVWDQYVDIEAPPLLKRHRLVY